MRFKMRRRRRHNDDKPACRCATCDGDGVIHCDDCDGTGFCEIELDDESQEQFDLIKQDAARLRDQAKRLTILKPDKADRYQQQLESELEKLQIAANKLLKTSVVKI